MSKNIFDLELSPLPTAFDDVIERLYEAAILHPQRTPQKQMDFTMHPAERREQILYYLQKTILIERHAKLAKEFAETLLKVRISGSSDHPFRYEPTTHFGMSRPSVSVSSGRLFRYEPAEYFGINRPSFSFFFSGAPT